MPWCLAISLSVSISFLGRRMEMSCIPTARSIAAVSSALARAAFSLFRPSLPVSQFSAEPRILLILFLQWPCGGQLGQRPIQFQMLFACWLEGCLDLNVVAPADETYLQQSAVIGR